MRCSRFALTVLVTRAGVSTRNFRPLFACRMLFLAIALGATACGGQGESSPTAPSGPATTSGTSVAGGARPPATVTPPVSPTAPASSTPASIAGNYTMSIRSAPTCPSASRDYAVTITQSGSTIAINGPNTSTSNSLVYSTFFGGTVTDSRMSVWLVVSEWHSNSAGFSVSGEIRTSVNGSTLTGTLNGEFGASMYVGCTAVNHLVTFTRRS